MLKRRVLWLSLSMVLVGAGAGQGAFRVCCGKDNDLLGVMRACGVACLRYATGQEAVATAGAGDGVLVLADGYPETLTAIDLAVYEVAAAKRVRLHVEYPSAVPGLELGEPRDFRTGPYGVRYDRTVAGTMAPRQMKTDLWDLAKSSKAGRHFEKYRKLMLPAAIIEEGPGKADVPVVAGSEAATRPVIKRLGAVQTNSLICPFVLGGRLYHLEHRLPQYYGVRMSECKSEEEFFGHARACIVDHETGEVVAEPDLGGFVMPHVFVDGGTVYVLASDFMAPSPPHGRTVKVWATKDLKTWERWTALELVQKWMVGSVSVCKKGDEYVMAMEVTGPVEEVGVGFTARFAKSTDMKHWQVLGGQCVYGRDRSCCPHSLRHLDGYFYLFYLEAGSWEGGSGYVTNVARSRDLVEWQVSLFNPVLCPSEKDKQIANEGLSAEKQAYVKNGGQLGQAHINNSDMEFAEHNGRVIIGYSCGAQSYEYGFIAEAVYEGTEAQFLRGWFPGAPQQRID